MKLDIVKHKFIYLAISAILLIPGIIAMVYSMITYDTHTPVKVGIDYTGGTTLQYGVKENITNEKLSAIIVKVNTNAAMAQLAEHVLGKDEVTSSNLVSSSKKFRTRKCADFFTFSLFTLHFSLISRARNFLKVISNSEE